MDLQHYRQLPQGQVSTAVSRARDYVCVPLGRFWGGLAVRSGGTPVSSYAYQYVAVDQGTYTFNHEAQKLLLSCSRPFFLTFGSSIILPRDSTPVNGTLFLEPGTSVLDVAGRPQVTFGSHFQTLLNIGLVYE